MRAAHFPHLKIKSVSAAGAQRISCRVRNMRKAHVSHSTRNLRAPQALVCGDDGNQTLSKKMVANLVRVYKRVYKEAEKRCGVEHDRVLFVWWDELRRNSWQS